jgi:hypothetical protein
MKNKLVIFLTLLSTSVYAQDMWESEFPQHINQYIFSTTHYNCLYSDYIDGIIAEEIIITSKKKTYIASFSVFGEPDQGSIEVVEDIQQNLSLSDISCPQI